MPRPGSFSWCGLHSLSDGGENVEQKVSAQTVVSFSWNAACYHISPELYRTARGKKGAKMCDYCSYLLGNSNFRFHEIQDFFDLGTLHYILLHTSMCLSYYVIFFSASFSKLQKIWDWPDLNESWSSWLFHNLELDYLVNLNNFRTTAIQMEN